MVRKVRWGILGTGKIANDFTNSLRVAEHAEVVAVGSRTKESAEKFAEKHHIPKAYGSYEELAKDPEVEIIYVSSPHPDHHRSTILSLKLVKYVLFEKPLAMNRRVAHEMI